MKARLQIGNEMREGFCSTLKCASGLSVLWHFKCYKYQCDAYGARNIAKNETEALEHFKSIGGIIVEEE